MIQINVYLPEDIDKKLEEYSGKEDLKKSATIRKALTAYFGNTKSEDEERLSSLEGEIQDINKTQKAILKKLGLKVKEEEPEEETFELVDEEDEEEESEEELVNSSTNFFIRLFPSHVSQQFYKLLDNC